MRRDISSSLSAWGWWPEQLQFTDQLSAAMDGAAKQPPGTRFTVSQQGPEDWDPDALLAEAQASLAGPLAEELLGAGDALSSIGELVEAAMLSDRAAELSNCDDTEVWGKTLRGTIALVGHHRGEIGDISELLERRGRISSGERSIRKILARVEQAPIDMGSVSERGLALARKIEDAVKELVR
jgi:hypothetical protein